jgi:hypothetical protein
METVLKDKFARDERSRETVQICFDNFEQLGRLEL